MHLNRRTGRDVEGLPCPDQSRDPQAMDRRQLAGRAMNDQVHVRLIALEFKNSANNQLLRGTYLRRPGAVRRGSVSGHVRGDDLKPLGVRKELCSDDLQRVPCGWLFMPLTYKGVLGSR